MPPGTPYDSFVLPYSIRVDEFTQLPLNHPLTPTLHLLTHTHTDHIVGLSSKSFGYTVLCSPDAKAMLLRHQVYAERNLYEQQIRGEKKRTFSHLRVNPVKQSDGRSYYTGARDLLKAVQLNTPTKIELSGNEIVTITLLDANHCPGAVMFLVEGPKGCILHTGDFRAEPWFLESLTANPFLQPYLSVSGDQRDAKTLDAIYLDTACTWSTLTPPTKQCATSGMIELMRMFDSTTYFFLNLWTWGYEDILTAVARSFDVKIHVDRYKYSILTHISDPILPTIVTRDPECTRFHACERFDRCKHMGIQKKAVFVNPVTMENLAWESYLTEMKTQLASGEEITTLLVPIWRHSPLPELQSFVNLFRPHMVIPNTLEPAFGGLDWMCINEMFKNHISPEGTVIVTALQEEISSRMQGTFDVYLATVVDTEAVEIKNLEGDGAKDVAWQWTVPEMQGANKLAKMRDYLADPLKNGIDGLLNSIRGNKEEKRTANEKHMERIERWTTEGHPCKELSDEDTDVGDEDEDERELTAYKLFSSVDQNEEQNYSIQFKPDDPTKERKCTPVKGSLPSPVTSPFHFRQLLTPPPFTPQRKVSHRHLVSSMISPLLAAKGSTSWHGEDHTGRPGLFSSGITSLESVDGLKSGNSGAKSLVFNSSIRTKRSRTSPDIKDAPKRRSLDRSTSDISKTADENAITQPSPREIAKIRQRSEARAERQRIAARLSRARPDLVIPSYTAKIRQKQLKDQ